MKTKSMLVTMVATACLLVASTGWAQITVSQSAALGSGDELEIDMRAGGSVELTGGGGGLQVGGEISGRDADRMRVTTETTSRGARIVTDAEGRNVNARLRLEVSVPDDVNVRLKTMGGDVTIRQARLELGGKSMGGDVEIRDSDLQLEFTTMGGDVYVGHSELNGSLRTMGGDFTMEEVTGRLDATTMGGDVDVDGNGAGIRIDTMGGDIRVGSAREPIVVETKGGDIRMAGLESDVDAVTMGGDIEAALEAGSVRNVVLESMGGQVTVAVPAGLGADIEIELEYTKDSRRNYTIESDFQLDREESAEWEYRNGNARKTIRATGSIGGGGSTIVVRTVNGDVRVVQR